MDLDLADFNCALEAFLEVLDKDSAGDTGQRFQCNNPADGQYRSQCSERHAEVIETGS